MTNTFNILSAAGELINEVAFATKQEAVEYANRLLTDWAATLYAEGEVVACAVDTDNKGYLVDTATNEAVDYIVVVGH